MPSKPLFPVSDETVKFYCVPLSCSVFSTIDLTRAKKMCCKVGCISNISSHYNSYLFYNRLCWKNKIAQLIAYDSHVNIQN